MCLYSSSWSPLNDSENGQEAQINVLFLFSLWALSTLAVWFPKKTFQAAVIEIDNLETQFQDPKH